MTKHVQKLDKTILTTDPFHNSLIPLIALYCGKKEKKRFLTIQQQYTGGYDVNNSDYTYFKYLSPEGKI